MCSLRGGGVACGASVKCRRFTNSPRQLGHVVFWCWWIQGFRHRAWKRWPHDSSWLHTEPIGSKHTPQSPPVPSPPTPSFVSTTSSWARWWKQNCDPERCFNRQALSFLVRPPHRSIAVGFELEVFLFFVKTPHKKKKKLMDSPIFSQGPW